MLPQNLGTRTSQIKANFFQHLPPCCSNRNVSLCDNLLFSKLGSSRMHATRTHEDENYLDTIGCMEWSTFSFAALNLPTCQWLGCSRALKPRRSASSAALDDEPGSDGQKHLELRLDYRTLCPRHSYKSSGSAATQHGADGSVSSTP